MDTRLHWPSLSSNRTWRSRRAFAGLALCVLAVVFALAAKVSWYRTGQTAHSDLASMKAFRADPPAASAAIVHAPYISPAITAFCLLLAVLALSTKIPASSTLVEGRTREPFHRRPIARPPPTRQA